MTQEEQDILIADLCGRLPYGLIIKCNDGFRQSKEKLVSIDVGNDLINYDWRLTDIKPYLRLWTSITEKEIKEIQTILGDAFADTETYTISILGTQPLFKYLNKKMIDYRGLIPKGLAIEAPEDMYEHEVKFEFNGNDSRIGIGCKIRSKTNPNVILSIVSDDCHGDEFECSNGSVLSLKQIEKYYDIIT